MRNTLLIGTSAVALMANTDQGAPKGDVGNVYRDKDGNVVKSNKAIAGAYREMASLMAKAIGGNAEIKLSDAVLLVIVRSIAGDGGDIDVARAQAVIKANDTPTQQPGKIIEGKPGEPVAPLPEPKGKPKSVAISRVSELFSVGAHLPEAIDGHLAKAANAKEEFTGALLFVTHDLMHKQTDDGQDLSDMIPNWPTPSTWHDEEPYNVTGYNGPRPDHYKYKVGDETVTGSRYADLYDGTGEGKRVHGIRAALTKRTGKTKSDLTDNERTMLSAALGLNGQKYDVSRLDNEFEAKTQLSRWTTRRNNSVNRLRGAVAAAQVWLAINAAKTGITVQYVNNIWTKDETGKRVLDVPATLAEHAAKKEPLQLVWTVQYEGGTSTEHSRPMPVTTFGKIDVAKAIADIEADPSLSPLSAFVATTRKAPTTGTDNENKGDSDKKGIGRVTTMRAFAEAMIESAEFLTGKDVFNKLMLAVEKDTPEAAQLIDAIGAVKLMVVDEMWPQIENRYEAQRKARNLVKEAKAKAGPQANINAPSAF